MYYENLDFQKLPSTISDLKEFKPTEVDLSENVIVNVTAIAELPVKVLNLSHCSISYIENASFKDLQQMEVLDLSHNKLTTEKLSPHAFEVSSFTLFFVWQARQREPSVNTLCYPSSASFWDIRRCAFQILTK